MQGLAVYVKEGLPFARELSLENSASSCLCFRLVLIHSVSYFFFLCRSPSSSLCMVFNSISFNIDKVLLINPSASVFVLDTLTSIIRTGLPILAELIDLVNSNDLTQIVNFPTRIPTMILTVLLFWIYFFLLSLVFVIQWLSLHWEILLMLLSQFPLTFHLIHNGVPHFIALHMTILVLIGTVFVII